MEEEEADEAEELEVVRPCAVGGTLGGGRPGDNRCVRRDCILSAQRCGAQEDSIVEESEYGTGEVVGCWEKYRNAARNMWLMWDHRSEMNRPVLATRDPEPQIK